LEESRVEFDNDVTIVGGCGHVGLPLGAAFAVSGLKVVLQDVNEAVVETVADGVDPYLEPGLDDLLEQALRSSCLTVTTDPSTIAASENVIIVIGTPVDRHMNPDLRSFMRVVQETLPQLRDGQLLILRSTVYPGVTALVADLMTTAGKKVDVAFCPERIAEGHALRELRELPQIVSGVTEAAAARADQLFRKLSPITIQLTPEEAEVAKLFTNAWRYIKFGVANQLYMVANDFGLDYEHIRRAIVHEYPRAADLPAAGFAAGPCLLKDVMQIAAFNNNSFLLGQASMSINEGLPLYVVSRLEQRVDLRSSVVGVLGMAFKGESPDPRSSLSYKLKRILEFKARAVLCTDPYVVDDDLLPLEEVLRRADVLVVGAPHNAYRDVSFNGPVADVWNLLGRGVKI
jgi:UDP-N-acetyl-D-mannosaminuronic acid dehydrogenase